MSSSVFMSNPFPLLRAKGEAVPPTSFPQDFWKDLPQLGSVIAGFPFQLFYSGKRCSPSSPSTWVQSSRPISLQTALIFNPCHSETFSFLHLSAPISPPASAPLQGTEITPCSILGCAGRLLLPAGTVARLLPGQPPTGAGNWQQRWTWTPLAAEPGSCTAIILHRRRSFTGTLQPDPAAQLLCLL